MKRRLCALLMYAAFLGMMISPAPANAQEMPADPGGIKAGGAYDGGINDVIRAQAGAMPDSYFYGLKRFGERLNLLLTFDKLEKAKLKYMFAERRLAEAAALAGKNDALAAGAIKEYDRYMGGAEEYLAEVSATGRNVSTFAGMVSDETYAHVFVLGKVYAKVPESAKPSVMRAIEISMERHEGIAEKYGDAEENGAESPHVNITVAAGNRTIQKEVPARFAEKFLKREKELRHADEPAGEKEISGGREIENAQPGAEKRSSAEAEKKSEGKNDSE